MAIDTKTLLDIINPPCPEQLTRNSIPVSLVVIFNGNENNTRFYKLTDEQKLSWMPIMCSKSFPFVNVSDSNQALISLLDELIVGVSVLEFDVYNIVAGVNNGDRNFIDMSYDKYRDWYYVYADIPEYQVDTYGIYIILNITRMGQNL